MEEEKKDEDLNQFRNSNRSGRRLDFPLKKIQFRNVNDFRNALTQDGKEVTEENQVRNYFDHNEKYNFFLITGIIKATRKA